MKDLIYYFENNICSNYKVFITIVLFILGGTVVGIVDIVVLGNIINETIIFPNKTIGPVLGSPCAYSSIIMARLGRKIGIVSYIGNDLTKDMVEQFQIVDTEGFIPYKFTTQNNLIYHADGNKSVEYAKVTPVIEFEDIPDNYLEAETFYICPMNCEVIIDIPKKLYEMGKKVIVDLGGFGGTTSYNHFSIYTRRGKALIDHLCKYSTIIKLSEEDLKYIIPSMSAEEATQYFIDKGAQAAVISLGEKGALCQTKGQLAKRIEAFPPECEEDDLNLVGAGDALAAGMIASLDDMQNLEEAVVYGTAVASLVIEKKGGCVVERMPTSFEVKRRLSKRTSILSS